jgi:hypothetical protein
MVDAIIILNLIGYFKVDFDSTFLIGAILEQYEQEEIAKYPL